MYSNTVLFGDMRAEPKPRQDISLEWENVIEHNWQPYFVDYRCMKVAIQPKTTTSLVIPNPSHVIWPFHCHVPGKLLHTADTLSCAPVTSARKMHRQIHSCMPLPPTYQQVWTAFRSTGPHSSRTTFVLNCSLSASMDGPTKATSIETFAVLASERGTCGKSLFPFMMTYHSMDTASCYHWACKRKHFRRSMADIKALSL